MPAHVPPVETKRKLPHLPELDGLRGLAALGVLFHHFMQPLGDDAAVHHSAVSGAIIAASGYGAMGVDVFFVLSGFLISSLLLVDREKTSYFHNFYWKRVLRIVPVYLVHLSLVAVLAPGSLGYILLSSVFLVNFASVFHMNGGGPTWTLSIEEQFYVLWPQAVRRLRLEFVYWLAFALIASSNLARILVPLWHGGINVQYTFYRCDGLALGAVLACQWFSPWRGSGFIRWTLDALNGRRPCLQRRSAPLRC
jgi:peptidoglycan/LPS O-acetylase OafA/YrhL